MEDYKHLNFAISENTKYPNRINKGFTKDLMDETDPLKYNNQSPNLKHKKKKSQSGDSDLTLEEGEKLLESWKENNFSDFNSWVQIARAIVQTECFESNNEMNPKPKNFICNLTLKYEDDPNALMIANGFGRNKKEAKKMAIEKIVIELIQSNEIKRGLKDKGILHGAQKKDRNRLSDQQKNLIKQIDAEIQKKVHKLSKRMQEALKKDKFLDACEILYEIIQKKSPDWNEVSFIWCYAIIKKNLTYVKAVLDIIQQKKSHYAVNWEEKKTNEDFKVPKDEHEKKAQQEILKKYGNWRLKTENPYDLVDAYNVEMNLPEIDNEVKEITDEEANAEIVKDPLSKDINKVLVQETIDLTLIDANKENTPNNQNSSNLKNFETNSASVSEKFQDKQDELDKDIFFKYSVNDQRSEEVYNQHMVLSYSLVKELYESILYIPDMHFVLSVAEIIYSKTKLDPKDFVNTNAAFYFANKLNMLIIEIAESIYQIFSKNKIKNVEYATTLYGRIQKIGLKYSEEVLIFSSNESSDQLEEKVSRKGVAESRDIYHQISEGDYVLLSLQSDDEFVSQFINNSNTGNANITSEIIASKEIKNKENSTTMIALVRDIEKDFKIKLMTLPNKFQSDAIMEKDYNWRIIKLNNRSTIEKTIESLETFCTKMTMVSPLYRILLAPPSCDSKMIQQLSEIDAEIPNLNKFPCKTNLNESQQSALNASKKQLLTLIQGPPGTGKTTTAVEIVLEWLRSNPSTILACADSNIAVDILHSEFMKAGIKAIRIGPGYDDKNDFKLDKNYKIYNSYYMTKQFHNANNIRFGIMKRMLQDAQVVCATCVGSTSDFLKGMNFQRVIIDEVTQATEMSTLIPLIRGCHQLVLIGDHKQLPPTVISTFAQSKGMTISLFERLIRQGIKPYLLSTQYRMHPSIALFPSYQFYNHKLINGIGDEHRLMVPGFAWPSNHIRVALINVVGSEQVYSSSIQNPKEVEVVLEVLIQLLRSGYNHISGIGIITPYDAQRRKIRSEINMQAKKLPQLFGLTQEQAAKITKNTSLNDVDTVDGFQGMERDLIIFSAVRSNKTGSLGFLKDPRRLNVTLTRAKRGLIVIGDINTLCHESNWRNWINWCKMNKIVLHYKQEN